MDYSFFDFLRLIGSLGFVPVRYEDHERRSAEICGGQFAQDSDGHDDQQGYRSSYRSFNYRPDPIIIRHYSHGGQFRKRWSAHSYPIHRCHNGSQYRYDRYRVVDLGSRIQSRHRGFLPSSTRIRHSTPLFRQKLT